MKRDLLFSAVYLIIIMAVGAGTYLVISHQERTEELDQLRIENEHQLRQIEIYREQIRIMDERLRELEELLTLYSALSGTGLDGLAPAIVAAGRATGTDPYLLAGIIAHESGWGSSTLARDKNNLAGLGAYDDCPGKAIRFDSREDCVFYLARLIADGGSLEEIGTWYASDPTWAEKVAGCMRVIGEKNHVY